MLTYRFENVLHGHIFAVQPTRQDGAAIDKYRWHIEAHHGHHHPWQRFVTARQTHKCVIAMTAHGQFHGVRNRFTRCQRGAHPLMPHRDPIGHSDGGKFAWCAIGVLYTQFHCLRLTAKRNVTRRCFVPAGGDTHKRLRDFVLGQAHRIVIRAMRCARRPLRHVTAWQFRLIEFALRHGSLPWGR